MKNKILYSGLLLCMISFALVSFTSGDNPTPKTEYAHITVLESIIPGGMGMSKMIITLPDGTQEEKELKNYYSLVGVNFTNVAENDAAITIKINELTAQGWKVNDISRDVLSISDKTNNNGLYSTKYLLSRTTN